MTLCRRELGYAMEQGRFQSPETLEAVAANTESAAQCNKNHTIAAELLTIRPNGVPAELMQMRKHTLQTKRWACAGAGTSAGASRAEAGADAGIDAR